MKNMIRVLSLSAGLMLTASVESAWCQGPDLQGPSQPKSVAAATNAVDAVAPSPEDFGADLTTGTLSTSSEKPPTMNPLPASEMKAAEPLAIQQESTAETAGEACPGSEKWHLPQPGFMQEMGIQMSGWLEAGMTFNDDHPADHFNGSVVCNDQDHEFQMNQLWMAFERPVNTGGSGFDIGGRIDVMMGTDWRYGIDNGLETRIDGFHDQTYGMCIPQAYLEVGVNDLTVKLGHMAGILDYEVVAAPGNAFYSHSYCYPYGVPVLVTGMLADYKLTDQLSIQAGFNRGWMQFDDNNESLDFMGGIRWRSEDQRTTIAWACDYGPQDPYGPYTTVGQDDRFVYSLVVKRQVTAQLQYVLVHDFGVEQHAAANGGQAEWYGLNQYLLYAINPRWSFNVRGEWMRDVDGVRIAGPGNIEGVRAWSGSGFAGNFYETTVGLNWRPETKLNLVFRPEIRYDWYDGAVGNYSPTVRGMPFNGGSSSTQLLFACDMVLMF